MKRKIGIWGFFGVDNFGDDYLLQLMTKQIRQISDDAIYVFSSSLKNAEDDIYYIPKNIKTSIAMALQLDVLIIGPGGLLPNKAPGKIAFFILLALLMRLRKLQLTLLNLLVKRQKRRKRLMSMI